MGALGNLSTNMQFLSKERQASKHSTKTKVSREAVLEAPQLSTRGQLTANCQGSDRQVAPKATAFYKLLQLTDRREDKEKCCFTEVLL